MAKLFVAVNHISAAVNYDYGHSQIVYDDGSPLQELEVSNPWNVTYGDWVYDPEQDHIGSNTSYTDPIDIDGYKSVEISLSVNQTAGYVWELMWQVRDQLHNGNFEIEYLFEQNSNSYIYTMLYIAGLSSAISESDLFIPEGSWGHLGVSELPGWGTNILFGAHAGGVHGVAISLELAGTAGNDIINTGIGDDTLNGQGGSDTISAGNGSDTLNGGSGDDTLNGGDGNDIAIYSGRLSNYTILDLGSDEYSVTDNVGSEGTDRLLGIEYLEFGGVSYQIADVVTIPTTDDNDTTATADIRPFSDWGLSGHVGGSDPDDYYRFITSGSGSFAVSLTGLSADLDLRILNNVGAQIALSDYSSSHSETITITYTDNQLYYVRVDPYGSAQSNYSLGFDVTADVGGGNTAPVLSFLASSSYTAGTVLTGNQLFLVSDADGASDINHITLWDSNQTNGAIWRYNGQVITPGGWAEGGFQFDYANRNLLSYTVGTGENDFGFTAHDNAGSSDYETHSITGSGGGNSNPDLTLTDVRLDATTIGQGGETTIRYNVVEGNGVNAGSTRTGFYISNTTSFSGATFLEYDSVTVTANESDSESELLSGLSSYGPGTYYLFAVADYADATFESNENNNRSGPIQITITGSGGGNSNPDLTLTDVRLDDTTIAQGGETTIRYNVVEGNGVNAGSTRTGFYISNTTSFSGATFLEYDSVTVTANESDSESELLSGLSSYGPGTYYLFAVADYADATFESNENNNRSGPIQITITAPTQVPEVTVQAASVTEAGEAVFSLGLDYNPTNASVEVFYRIEGGTATEGVDFETRLGQQSVVLTSDSTDITIRVNTIPDGLVEGDETINLIIDQVTGGAVAQSNHYLTILDDDTSNSAPRFWFDPVDTTGVEGSSFTFQLSGDVNQLTGDPLMEAYLHGLTVDDVVSIDVQFRDQTNRSLVTHTFQEVNGSWTNITTGQAFILNAANNPYIRMPLENYSLANVTLDYQITVHTRDDLNVEGPETAFWEVVPYLTGTLQHFPGLTTLQEIIVTDNDVALNQPPSNLQINGAFSVQIEENSLGGTLVGTLSASDPDDTNESLVYTLLNDAGGRFRILGNQVLVADGADLDFEDATIVNHSHMINVQVTDSHGEAELENFFIFLQNTNDAPMGGVSISGTATEGETLAVNTSALADADGLGSFSYQWLRDGVEIIGATGATYGLEQDDVGAEISVRVGYTDGQSASETVTSSVTEAIEANVINLTGTSGSDRLVGGNGNDVLNGGDGTDTLIGGDGHDTLIGGTSRNDLRDVIYGGEGDDTIDGGYGNDELRGEAGDDVIDGGFGADRIIGGDGNDRLGGGALGDELFGGDGFDFVNGGWGYDRINGGSGGDQFFHIGIFDHGSDWIQDYNSVEGDVLMWGGAPATVGDFQVNLAHTADAFGERSGDDAVQEAFVIYILTGQIMWALVDGGGQDQINLQIGGEVFDLLG